MSALNKSQTTSNSNDRDAAIQIISQNAAGTSQHKRTTCTTGAQQGRNTSAEAAHCWPKSAETGHTGAEQTQNRRNSCPQLSILDPENINSMQFTVLCRMLRNSGLLDIRLPGQCSLSLIDHISVRLSISPRAAALALITGYGLLPLFLEILSMENKDEK